MRRAARTDRNHAEIVKALRAIGASVADTSGVGAGYPDLTVGYRDLTFCVELKDGQKPPSARKLTPAQVEFAKAWKGHWVCVTSAEDAVNVVATYGRKDALRREWWDYCQTHQKDLDVIPHFADWLRSRLASSSPVVETK